VNGAEGLADERLMDAALDAAASANHATSPNPMVGAVVVRDQQVIATGAHQRAGEDHAEITALKDAGDRARGAELYVTLEPCVHQGRTPPCVDAVIASGVGRVVVAMADPNPRVSGRGITALREAGITVDVGVRAVAAEQLNEFYVKWVTTGLPFITAKFAMSLDGRIATASGESHWITSEEARHRAHGLRHVHDAILVGVNTVIRDDPALSTRLAGDRVMRSPLRIVVDSTLRAPLDARVFREGDGGVVVATSDRAGADQVRRFGEAGVTVLVLPAADGRVALDQLMRWVAEHERISVLVEGGAAVHGSLFELGLVDKVVAFIAPRIIGGADSPAAVGGRGVKALPDAHLLERVAVTFVGTDVVVSGYCR
jgi:diaminohydroxyphosphoribosylaminopyrimidine deaminase/5-amino-6-(5-phosphoribosylamino)uracil reductase